MSADNRNCRDDDAQASHVACDSMMGRWVKMGTYRKDATDRRSNRTGITLKRLPLEFASAFGEQVIFAIDVNHSILENTLPLVLDPSDLIIRAENDISVGGPTLVFVFLVIGIGIIQITIDGLRIILPRGALRRLRKRWV